MTEAGLKYNMDIHTEKNIQILFVGNVIFLKSSKDCELHMQIHQQNKMLLMHVLNVVSNSQRKMN